EACGRKDIALLPMSCGNVAYTVRGEVKDPNKVPLAAMEANPAAAPTLAEATTTFTITPRASDPRNRIALSETGKGTVGWAPVGMADPVPAGCPAGVPSTLVPPMSGSTALKLTFNNTSPVPVSLDVSGAQGSLIHMACIAGGQTRAWQVPASA